LNLQNASVVVNCDLPWNPAKLEQRIARAWRKYQTRPVTVINLISEKTIEHRMLETLSNKQALSEGVLDLKGDLAEIKLRSGRQAFLSKLQQLMTPTVSAPAATNSKPPLPADRALGFAQAAHQRINGNLSRCEERYPLEGHHSVLYVVVERDAPQWRENLNALHNDYFGPGQSDPLAPVRLEVVDRATDEALQRLFEAGLAARTTRATRPLWPLEGGTGLSAPLSDVEREKAAAHRQRAKRKLKMAEILTAGGFSEEARAAVLDAVLPFGCALAVENRLPEPASLQDALSPPLGRVWKDALSIVRAFVQDASQPVTGVAALLEGI
jgi:hypothetical protein